MMIHPDISAALARERARTFLDQAQAAHQGRLARLARSPANGKRVALRDGSKVLIRPVRSDDTPRLAGLLARLSGRARQAGIPPGDPQHEQTSQPVSQPC